MDYYSARLHIIVLIDDGEAKAHRTCDESIVVFQARAFEHAFERSLQIGKGREIIYQNGDGENVRWALVEIVEIRQLGETIDGVEVMSKLFEIDAKFPLSFDYDFKPETKEPLYN